MLDRGSWLRGLLLSGLVLGCGDGHEAEAPPVREFLVRYTLRISDFGADTSLPEGLVDDAEVCEYEYPSNCVRTDVTGHATIALLGGIDTGVVVEKDGYPRILVLRRLDEQLAETLSIPTEQMVSLLSALVDVEWPEPGKGVLAMGIDGETTGRSVEIAPGGGQGPFYMDADGVPDAALTATSSEGVAFIAGLDPGEYEVTWSPDCRMGSGWPRYDEHSTTRVAIEAETLTIVFARCHLP